MHAAAKNLRTVERFLLVPPLPAHFASWPVSLCDISAQGARFRSDGMLETGKKGVLSLRVDGAPSSTAIEAMVVWSQPDGNTFISGARTYGPAEVVQKLVDFLQTSKRSHRIEELRSADRFRVAPVLEAKFGDTSVAIANLAAHGACIEMQRAPAIGTTLPLRFSVPGSQLEVSVAAEVIWTMVRAVDGSTATSYRAGLQISEKAELIRLAIGLLGETGRATLDANSLVLKLKIMRARARQGALSAKAAETSGLPADQYLLIRGVSEELRMNPEEAMHWYRRARLIINDAKTREAAPAIADYPDALAVWEYLDRTVDPSMIGRALNLVRS